MLYILFPIYYDTCFVFHLWNTHISTSTAQPHTYMWYCLSHSQSNHHGSTTSNPLASASSERTTVTGGSSSTGRGGRRRRARGITRSRGGGGTTGSSASGRGSRSDGDGDLVKLSGGNTAGGGSLGVNVVGEGTRSDSGAGEGAGGLLGAVVWCGKYTDGYYMELRGDQACGLAYNSLPEEVKAQVLLPTVRVSPLSGMLQLSLKSSSSSSSELEAVVARLTTAALVVAAVAAGELVTEALAVAGQLMTRVVRSPPV